MKKVVMVTLVLCLTGSVVGFLPLSGDSGNFTTGTPEIRSMSALTFGPQGILFLGDSKSGTVFALDLEDRAENNSKDGVQVDNVEGKIAGLLGTTSDAVLIHDMAVNPVSQNIYLAVSRSGARANWQHRFLLPNDLADANLLLRVTPAGKIEEVPLKNVKYAKAVLPNPVDENKIHRWKEGIRLRVDTITDIALEKDKLFVAGLSNEEFASTMWQIPYPFQKDISATSVEIFHGAHGKYETHAPIRTFLPYELNGELNLLAAYLCTPLVRLNVSDLKDGQHLKGRTVAEFGSGNYPLDMLAYEKDGKKRILIANSNLPLMVVDPEDVENYTGSITTEVEGYTSGVTYEVRSGAGIQQLDRFNSDYFVALQRMSSGRMDLLSYSVSRF